MKKVIIIFVMTSFTILLSGCDFNKEYYCNEGDTLISDTCLHKTITKAKYLGCSNILGCNNFGCQQVLAENINSLCQNKTISYKCQNGEGELIGDTCVKEETYPAHTR